MTNKYFILFFIFFGLLFHSCVSKKKFLEMQDGRLKAEKQVRQLKEENNALIARIEALIADFETMKNELLESNALKDQYIDSLNHEIFTLDERLEEQKESLQETSFTYGFEQQRMKEMLESRAETIRTLESQIESLEKEISEQASVIDDKNFQINRLNDEILTLEDEIERGEQQRQELEEELQKVKAETDALKAEINEKDVMITRLQNNVKLLKNELGEN
jgi:chromosome segregation ATPase